MKILQLYTDLRLGGIERFVLDISQELARRGHDVILATHWSDAFDEMRVVNGEQPLFRRLHFGKTDGGFSWRVMCGINRLIWSEKPDIVHTNLFSLLYVCPSMLLKMPLKTSYVHTVHSQAEKEWPTPSYRLTKYLYLHRTTPVSISDRVHETMVDRYPGVDSPVIFNGCCIDADAGDVEAVQRLQNIRNGGGTGLKRRVFLHIGHLSANKNQKMLNRVAMRLINEGYDFAIAIVGRNDDKGYAEEFFKERCEAVHYLGPCCHVQALLRAADFFTLCSGYEGMPISLLEAIGNGCVPVCIPAGGIPNGCMHHVNGLLAQENTEDGLYSVMKEALELSEADYAKYCNASLKLFQETFSIETCAKQYENLYLSLIKR